MEGFFLLLAIGGGIWWIASILKDPRAEALAREVEETEALLRELKRVVFEVTQEKFLEKLRARCVMKVVLEGGYNLPDELWEQYCLDITGALPKMYPKIEDLRFKHFTEAHQHIEFRKQVREFVSVYKNGPKGLDDVIDVFAERLYYVMIMLPDESLLHDNEEGLSFDADIIDLMKDPSLLVQTLMFAGSDEAVSDNGAFEWLREQCRVNWCEASGVSRDKYNQTERKRLIIPTESKLPIKAQVKTYLHSMPFKSLFEYKVNLAFPEEARFEHHHIVAGSGHGKTQTLQYLIANDLKKVQDGEASIVVIDSQGDLIRNIQKLDIVEAENLVLIDPTDVEFPVCLNLFDVQMDRINSYSRLHREQMINGILELYDFVLGSLLGAEMTQKQSVIFRYVTRLLLQIPDATIHTMLELFQDGGAAKYKPYIAKLEGTARIFFEDEFDSREFTQTKRQVVRRLYGILENQAFNRMFSHPRSKLDLFSEMNTGKVILINTAKDLLKENGTQIFGRFFIAMIAQAAQERATIPSDKRMPTYVYIDEAHEYFDENIGIILSQARKFKIGMIMAHQFLDQLSPKLQSAFMSNTSIKFAGGVSMKDARSLAGEMRVDPDFITSQPKGSFAVTMRGLTKKAIALHIPFGHMESLERHSSQELDDIRNEMRQRYAVPIDEMDDPMRRKTPEENVETQKSETTKPKPARKKPLRDPDNPASSPTGEL